MVDIKRDLEGLTERHGFIALLLVLVLGATIGPFARRTPESSPTVLTTGSTQESAATSCVPQFAPHPLRPLEEFLQLTRGNSQTIEPTRAKDVSQGGGAASQDAARVLHESLCTTAVDTSVDAPPTTEEVIPSQIADWTDRLNQFRDLGPGKNYQLETLICCLPDPEFSHFGFRFDTAVSAIQVAVQGQGFVMDGFWFPWSHVDPEGRNRIVQQCETARPRSLTMPGAILFREINRNAQPSQRLLLALIIGESPTSGIHKTAFIRGVTLCQWLANRFGTTQDVRVMGPCFSGSEASFRDAVCSLPLPLKKMRVVSGGAVSINPQTLKDEIGRRRPTLKGAFEFHLAILPEDVTRENIISHIRKLNGGQKQKIAMLVESNTGFGSAIRAANAKDYTLIPFPLQISRLQSQSERDRAERAARISVSGNYRLPIAFDESRTSPDTITPYSPEMTSVVADRVMDNLLTTLAREDFRYVLIVATDIRDKIFLANAVRKYCPDVQLLSTASDLLLAHPDYLEALKGTLVASTYPLYPRTQLWTHPFAENHVRLQFANQSDQGYYNATCLLLNTFDLLTEYAPPFRKPSANDRLPVVWFSMVGNSGLTPITFGSKLGEPLIGRLAVPGPVGQELGEAAIPNALEHRDTMRYSTAALLFIFGLSIVSIAYCAAFLYVSYRTIVDKAGSQRLAEKGFVRLFWPREDVHLRRQQLICVCVGLMSLLVVSFYIAEVALIPVPSLLDSNLRGLFSPDTVQLLIVCAVAVIAVSICGSLFVALALAVILPVLPDWIEDFLKGTGIMEDERKRRLRAARGVATVVVGLVFLAALTFMVFIRTSIWTEGREIVYFLRTIDVREGLSPLVPLGLLFGVIYWWSIFQLRRLREIDRLYLKSPLPAVLHGLDLSDASLVDVLKHPWNSQSLAAWMGIAALLGVVMLRLNRRFLPTEDGDAFNLLCRLAFAASIVLLVSTLVHFHSLWRRVDNLLQQIYRLPMHQAWDRIPEQVAVTLGQFLNAREPRLAQFHTAVHQWGRVTREYGQLNADAGNRPAPIATPDLATGFRAEIIASTLPISASLTQLGLATAAQQCAVELQNVWPLEPTDVAYRAYTAQQATDTRFNIIQDETVRNWYRLSEDFVAIEVVLYVSQYFVSLRNLLTCLTVCSLLLLLGVTSYPFQPRLLALITVMVVSGVIVVTVATAFTKINQDGLTSRIEKTAPNRLTLDRGFLASIATYLIPIVIAVGAQVGNLFGVLMTWLDPVLRVLH